MKTLTISLFAMLLSLISYGKLEASNEKPGIASTIFSQMSYPAKAVAEKIEGSVNVVFRINNYGNVEIFSANSEYDILKDYVVDKLSRITINQEVDTNSFYKMKFDFQLI